jgi:putative SOS response-associated peptidase YedK
MCGRFVATSPPEEIARYFGVTETADVEGRPNYNVAPTTDVWVVHADGGVRRLDPYRWGLIPTWAKDMSIGSRMINARSETITQKPAFKAAAAKRRCVLPADGYYEWMKGEDGKKIPFFLHADGPISMAGLYELWPNPELPEDHPDRWLWTCTVLTRPATDAAGHIHERSPVILPDTFVDPWLDPGLNDRDDVDALLNSIPEPTLELYEVSTAVNSPRNNNPDLLRPVDS